MARKRRKGGATRKRRRSSRRAGVRLVRRGTTVYQGNPRRRRRSGRRRYRRNPFGGGIMKRAFQGAKDASLVVGGKFGTRLVTGFLPIPKDGIMGIAAQGVAALLVGWLGGRFLGADAGRMLLAGGLAAPIESFAKNLPIIGDALADDDMGEYLMGEDVGEYLMAGEDIGEDVGEDVGEYQYA